MEDSDGKNPTENEMYGAMLTMNVSPTLHSSQQPRLTRYTAQNREARKNRKRFEGANQAKEA
jgi:hypothetical protein